jgi:hypothetical protein
VGGDYPDSIVQTGWKVMRWLKLVAWIPELGVTRHSSKLLYTVCQEHCNDDQNLEHCNVGLELGAQ